MAAAQEKIAEKYGDVMESPDAGPDSDMGMKMTLRSELAYGNTPKVVVEQLDAVLWQVLNTQMNRN